MESHLIHFLGGYLSYNLSKLTEGSESYLSSNVCNSSMRVILTSITSFIVYTEIYIQHRYWDNSYIRITIHTG